MTRANDLARVFGPVVRTALSGPGAMFRTRGAIDAPISRIVAEPPPQMFAITGTIR